MYLAEDRVMCLEILTEYSSHWILRYVAGARALTDPPDSIIELIKQRRRWTNGSMFASWHVLDNINRVNRSDHSLCRKVCIYLLYIYMLANFMFTLVLVGSLYASFSIFIRAFFDDEECDDFGGARAFEYLYLFLIFIFTMFALTLPIKHAKWIYSLLVVVFGIYIYISIGFGFVYFWKSAANEVVGWLLMFVFIASYTLVSYCVIHLLTLIFYSLIYLIVEG